MAEENLTGPGQGLDKATLINDIITINNSVKTLTDPDEIDNLWAQGIAEAIDKFIRSGKVITVGSATTQQGTIT